MQEIGLNDLLKAGVHFGHQTRRWNPKMRKFIFTERNGIHIIDLRKTLDRLQQAQQAVREVVAGGERVLFVCTKRQLRQIIEEEAERSGAFYVTERWLGGMLTNFQTIRKQIRRLKELERGQEENAFEFYTKKERLLLDRERQKLEKYLSGVKDMSRLPGAVFVVDAKREIIAVREAYRLDIPVIAITDTNADPDYIDYPVPGNDDAIRSVGLITRAIADAVEMAKKEVPEGERGPGEVEATTYSTETGETTEVEERPVRRRQRRKRRPRPEVIAKIKGGDEEDDEADEEVEEVEEVEDQEDEAADHDEVEAAGESAQEDEEEGEEDTDEAGDDLEETEEGEQQEEEDEEEEEEEEEDDEEEEEEKDGE